MRDRLDTLSPDSLVKLGVEANIGGTHGLLSKFNDGLDSPWSTFLEGATMHAPVKVDCLFIGSNVFEGRTRLATGL